MQFKGRKFRLNKKLGFRPSTEQDVYEDGKPIDSNYVSFVKLSDCPTYEKDGKLYYDAKDVKSIMLSGHSLTTMAFGVDKVRKSELGVWIFDEKTYQKVLAHEYIQYTIYLVHNHKVYTSSRRRLISK